MNRNLFFRIRLQQLSMILGFGLLAFAGCKQEGRALAIAQSPIDSQPPQSWIDAPLNESHLLLAPYEIVFHISGEPDVAMGELVINGQVIALLEVDNPGKKLATLRYLWEPTEPGKYIIHSRARTLNGEWGPFESAVVYIDPIETLTLTPTLTPTLEIMEDISDVSVQPNVVNIGGCNPNQVTISARAMDEDGIKVVVVFYRFRWPDGTATDWKSESMNPKGEDIFEKTILITSAASSLGFNSKSGTFEYQIVIQDINQNMTRDEVRRDVTVNACPGFNVPLRNIEVPRIIITLVPTKTPIIIK